MDTTGNIFSCRLHVLYLMAPSQGVSDIVASFFHVFFPHVGYLKFDD